MQSSRAEKPKSRKSSKPPKKWTARRYEIAEALESDRDNVAMVACSECVNHNVVYYYDREQSVKCAACLRHQRECDGTFSLKEFRRVGEQKWALRSKARDKQRRVARLRRTLIEARKAMLKAESELASAEESDLQLQDSLAKLEEKSNNMLKREMQALGVLNSVDSEQEVALAEPNFA